MSAEATLAIQRTIALYGQLLDDLRLEEWGGLFTEDGVWAMPGLRLEGRERIVKEVRRMEPDRPGFAKHPIMTPVIALDGEDRARAWTDFLVLRRDGFSDPWKLLAAGRFCDVLVCEDGVWRFKVRVCDLDPENRPDIGFEPSPSV